MSNSLQDLQDRIRELAYLMWEAAGRQQGMALEYWVAAERAILNTWQAAADRMLPQAASSAEATPAPSVASPPAPATADAAAAAAAPPEAPLPAPAPASAATPAPAAEPDPPAAAKPKPAARRVASRSKTKP